MFKKFTLLLFLSLISVMVYEALAVPAVPWPVEKTQPDGTKITVLLKGDEKVHWMESLDGYTLMYDANKFIVYAEKNGNGNLIPSKVRMGKAAAPKSLQKGLRYSAEQVNTLQQIWGIDKGPQKAFLGSKKVFMVLMDFSDRQMVKSQADFDALMNQVGYTVGGAKGSVRDFYLENSYNQLTLEVTVAGPYRADHNAAYYPGLGTGEGGRALANEAVNKADADGVDFSEFAVNGLVETFHVIFAGYGAETGLSSSQYIWSHAWNLGGSVVKDGVSLSRYSCSPELRGTNGTDITYIGVIAHELGHVFGAPDYYDVSANGGGGYDFIGTGDWDLMAGGSWNDGGRQPAHINPYQKIKYGWITPTTPTPGMPVTDMPASATQPVIYKVEANANGEHYLLENKQLTGFDGSLPGHGLVIWHVAATVSDYAPNDNHPLQLYPVCAASSTAIPTNTPSSYGNINSAGTPFPGTSGKTNFTDGSTPQAFTWSGLTGIGKPITDITEANQKISFDYINVIRDPVTNLQANVNGASVTLTWTAPANNEVTGYKIYRNGNLIYTIGNPATVTYTQNNVPNGTYTYGVAAVYPITDSEQETATETVTGGSDAVCSPVSNLKATSGVNNVNLSWTAPFTGGWVGISGNFYNAYTIGKEWESFQGTLWSPADLVGLEGYQISKIKFVPYENVATYEVVIYEVSAGNDPEEIYREPITSGSLDYSGIYNEITLANSVEYDPSKGLIIGVQIHSMGGYYISVDNGAPHEGRNVFFDEDGWSTFEDLGIPLGQNFCLAAYLDGASGAPVILDSRKTVSAANTSFLKKAKSGKLMKATAGKINVGPEQASAAVTEYVIYRDGVQIATTTSTSYQDATVNFETTYSYCISVAYDNACTSEPVCVEATTENPFKVVENLQAKAGINDVKLTWEAPSQVALAPIKYIVEREGTQIAEVTETTYTDNTVSMMTPYEYCVKAVYDGALYIENTIFEHGFEDSPIGWTVFDDDGDGKNWGIFNAGGTAHGGTKIAGSYSYENGVGPLNPDNWLITPQITLTANAGNTLEYYVAALDASWSAEHYGVYISTTTNSSTSSFTLLSEETMTAVSGNQQVKTNRDLIDITKSSPQLAPGGWKKRSIDLSAYAGQTVYLAFRHFDCFDQYMIMLDDIKITETIATNTTLSGTSDPVCITVETDNPYKPIATMEAKVIASDVSLKWTLEGEGDNRIVILGEGFDGGSAAGLPAGWTNVDADSDGYGWYQLNTNDQSALIPHGGLGIVTSASYQNGALNPDNWLISPVVTLTDNNILEYWVGAQDASYAFEHYGVYISTTNTNPGSFTKLTEETITAVSGHKINGNKVKDGLFRTSDYPEYVQGTWYQKTIDLSAYAGQTVYIAFRHFNCSDWFRINIDDVKITAPAADNAFVPVFNVYDNNTLIAQDISEQELELTGVAIGSHTYCVEAVYENGSIVTDAKCKTIVVVELGDPYRPVSNLQGSAVDYEGTLTWETPKFAEKLRYHTFESGSYSVIGTSGAADFDIAARFTPEQLQLLDGLMLTKVKFIAASAIGGDGSVNTVTYSVRVWQGGEWSGGSRDAGTLLVDQLVSAHEAGAWNTVDLDAPVGIDPTQELWIGLRCNTVTGRPAAMQLKGAVEGKGNLMYFQGSWGTATELGGSSLSGNWIIDGIAAYHQGLDAAPVALSSLKDAENRISTGTLSAEENFAQAIENAAPVLPAVTKYEISREGETIGETTELTYTDNVTASGTYTYTVTAVYDGGISSMPAEVDITYISECDNAPENVTAVRTDNKVNITWDYTPVVIPGESDTYVLLHEDFNAGLPTGWTTIDADGDGEGWDFESDDETGDGFMTSYSWYWDILTPDNWLITPQIELKEGSTLNYNVYSVAAFPEEHYGVYISTTDTDPSSFTLLFEETLDDPNGTPKAAKSERIGGVRPQLALAGSQVRTIDLSDYAGQTIYIAFRHFDCSDWLMMAIDDVTVEAPKAPKPVKFNIYRNDVKIAENIDVNEYEDTLTENGTYTYCVSFAGNYCESVPVCAETVDITTSIDPAGVSTLKVYPNPVKSGQEFYVASEKQDATIRIFSISGILVHQQQATGSLTKIRLTLPAGLYILDMDGEKAKIEIR